MSSQAVVSSDESNNKAVSSSSLLDNASSSASITVDASSSQSPSKKRERNEEDDNSNDDGQDNNSENGSQNSASKGDDASETQAKTAKNKGKVRKFNKDGEEIGFSTRSNIATNSVIDKALRRVFEGPLGLDKLNVKAEIGETKTRTHVNPLSIVFSKPVPGPQTADEWKNHYENPNLPLFIDVGCAAGRFSLVAAQHEDWKNYNHLGLEIRAPLVTRANHWVKSLGLKNVYYVSCNANTSIETLIAHYPGPIMMVAVQFPDPHFKKKHHKRRVVNKEFLDMMKRIIKPGGKLFMQSDVEEIAAQMRDRADLWACPPFRRIGGQYSPRDPLLSTEKCALGDTEECWTAGGLRKLPSQDGRKDYGDYLLSSEKHPTGVPTEREVQNEALNLPIYRVLYVRDEDKSDSTASSALSSSSSGDGISTSSKSD